MFGDTNGSSLQGNHKGRVRVLSWIIVAVVLLYLVRLFDLEVVHGSYYRKQSFEIVERTTPIPARRGLIFDRNYDRPLATNRPSFAVDVVPGEVKGISLHELLARLSSLLDLTVSNLASRIPAKIFDRYAPIEVDSGLPYTTIAYLAEHIQQFPGVTWHSKPVRSYPFANSVGSLSHVIGYVGDITPAELSVLYNDGYSADSVIGKDGVEKVYDKVLRGRDGERYQLVDARGRRVGQKGVVVAPPVDGNNIVLTINRRIQRLAQKALGHRTGAIVVLRPATGAILALVSYPWYNPNLFYQKHARARLDKEYTNPHFPFLNRAIQETYSPASTFKIIMTTADIATNVLPPDRYLNIMPTLTFGGRIWHNWEPVHFPHMDLEEGFAQSNDVFFWTLGRYLGINRIDDFAARFGLGRLTDIDLPDEVRGVLPTPQWKLKAIGKPWVGGDTLNMSIGQSYLLVTPIQMADVVAMVVNKGVVYRPHLLKEVRNPVTGAVIKRYHRHILLNSGVPRSVFTQVQRDMRYEVTHGTANVVITEHVVKIGAKTGTGQTGIHGHYTSWFASFGPYGDPNPRDQLVVLVLVDAQNLWQWWGPKAACIVWQGIFAHQTYRQAIKALEPVWWINRWVLANKYQ